MIGIDKVVYRHGAYKGDADVYADSHHGPLLVLHQFELNHIGGAGFHHPHASDTSSDPPQRKWLSQRIPVRDLQPRVIHLHRPSKLFWRDRLFYFMKVKKSILDL
jgi:hypothetical protein